MPAEGPLRDGTAAGFELIETLRWEPGDGLPAARPASGAALTPRRRRLASPATRRQLVRRARTVARAAQMPLRVRLTLARRRRGRRRRPRLLEPLPRTRSGRCASPSTRLDSGDPLLRHKTTRRQRLRSRARRISARGGRRGDAAQRARRGLRGHDHQRLRRHRRAGALLTPPLPCGLLPGVLRGELLEQGKREGGGADRGRPARGEGDLCRQFAARADQGKAGIAARHCGRATGRVIAKIRKQADRP